MYPGVANYRRPVKCVYNPDSGEHLFTADTSKVDHLVSLGWHDENIAFDDDPHAVKPVYRVRNPNNLNFSHHFTTDKNGYENLKKLGWMKALPGMPVWICHRV